MKTKQFTVNPFGENTYVIWDEQTKDAAIIDCGALFEAEEARIAEFVMGEGLQIKALLNTHLHLDHCFGNHWAKERYGVSPTAHKADLPFLAKMDEQVRMFDLPAAVIPEPLGQTYGDGDTIRVGGIEITVIHTPGHTPGGVCLYARSEGALFSGDTLFQGSVGRSDLEGGSHQQLIRSIKERLMVLPGETKVYAGHGPYTSIAHEKENNPFL